MPGAVLTGRVASVREFGAFVDLGGGIQGLLHVSEIGWSRVSDPSEMLKPGDEITVKVLRVDDGTQKIALGLKQLTEDPWSTAATKFVAGQVYKGRVTRHAKFGVFVELAPGIDALMPNSESGIAKEGDVARTFTAGSAGGRRRPRGRSGGPAHPRQPQGDPRRAGVRGAPRLHGAIGSARRRLQSARRQASRSARTAEEVVTRADVLAGLTAAAVVAPKAMAYATIAGLPVQVGLYTAIVPMAVYAALGTSRPLSVSTTTTIAILTAAALGQVAPDGSASELIPAAATLSILVGALLILASAIRLGFVANFISEPVLTGFKSGIGLVIVVDQIPKLLGIHITKAGFFRDLLAIVQELPATSVATVLVAVLVIALIFALHHFVPQAPAPLVAIGLAIGASAAFNLTESGVAVIGAVSGGLPSLIRPQVELAR